MPKKRFAGRVGHEPYEQARQRWEEQAGQTVPEELREILTAEALGVSLQELREMPWQDVEDRLAFERGRRIANGSNGSNG